MSRLSENVIKPAWRANFQSPGVLSFEESQTTEVAGELQNAVCPAFLRIPNSQCGGRALSRRVSCISRARITSTARCAVFCKPTRQSSDLREACHPSHYLPEAPPSRDACDARRAKKIVLGSNKNVMDSAKLTKCTTTKNRSVGRQCAMQELRKCFLSLAAYSRLQM